MRSGSFRPGAFFFAGKDGLFISVLRPVFRCPGRIMGREGGEILTVVYLDSVFVLNALTDYFLLLATAQLAGVPLRRRRFVLSAVLGGLYAAAVFLPGGGFLSAMPGKLLSALVMALTAYGWSRMLPRLMVLLLLVSCGFAGCVLALGLAAGGIPVRQGIFYTDVDLRVLLLAAGGAYIVFSVVFRAGARQAVRGTLTTAEAVLAGRSVRLRVLCDTGNALRDPVTGRPVLVVWEDAVRQLWPPELRPFLTERALLHPAETMALLPLWKARFRLVPYRAVGVPSGLLLAVRTDWCRVGARRWEELLLALSPTELGEGFTALWGEMERSEEHEPFTAAAT